MDKLWHFDDYVNHLTHDNGIVRRWAFNALDNWYSNKYAAQVSYLLNDEDEYMVCNALRYLSRHQAIDHAPAILEKFQSGKGIIASNCAITLARMKYEPALDTILEKFLDPGDEETLLGIFQYLGEIRSDKSREGLLSAVNQLDDSFLLSAAVGNLLQHYQLEDVKLALDIYFDSGNRDIMLLKNILSIGGAASYFSDLTEYDKNLILSEPVETLKDLLIKNSQIRIDQSSLDRLIQSLENKQYEDFITSLMFEARSIISSRYSNINTDHLKELFEQDKFCLAMLEDLSKRPDVIKEKKESSAGQSDFISFVFSLYLGIIERGAYVNAYLPDASKEDLVYALENAGSYLPKRIQEKIKEQPPVSEIKQISRQGIDGWGGIWTVRMMGEIGDKAFVSDLVHILSEADSLDYIYGDALHALNILDESADELILAAIKNNELDDWEAFPVLEQLPYSEAYDLAVKRWDDENDDMDSFETLANCLKGIGDKRGIEKLQEIYTYENDFPPVEDALECLSQIYQVDIPELQEIRENRKEREERQKEKERRFSELLSGAEDSKEISNTEKAGKVVPFKRDTPKIGRNDPCPCGSGKKYKKCCLNKDNL